MLALMAEAGNDKVGVSERKVWSRRNVLLAIFIAIILTLGAVSIFGYDHSGTPYKQTTSTSQNPLCAITAEGTGTYVTVTSDSGQPLQGVQVSGIRVTDVETQTCSQDIGTLVTNSTGSVLLSPNMASY
jgi:hypothetical protein